MSKKRIEQYEHSNSTRPNNPDVGLVSSENDVDGPPKSYQYDPHLDPSLVWAGKAERTSFEVPTVSLHVHERIDPHTIIESVKKNDEKYFQPSLFERPKEKLPLRHAIEFYKHKRGWSNRLIAGDSLLVMNSMLEKEGMSERVQMIYFDPPYGIKYGSNFQPFVNRREVKDGKDSDLTSEPEMIRAFRDTWELGVHSYLSYMRDRLLLARSLLKVTGSIFVQISADNLHHVREVLDEVFGPENFISIITYVTTSGFPSSTLSRAGDYLLWYARDAKKIKYHQLYKDKQLGDESAAEYKWVLLPDGTSRSLTQQELLGMVPLPDGARAWRHGPLTSSGSTEEGSKPFEYQGQSFSPGANNHWKVTRSGLQRLADTGLLIARKNSLSYYLFLDNYPVTPINNFWADTKWGFDAGSKSYVVQTNVKIVERCIQMTTDPGDLIFDPTCGSGTTAFAAEKWGRRWITCDTSRIAVTLTKQRLITALFDYYELEHPTEGVDAGFKYKTVPHVTLKAIANNEKLTKGLTQKQVEEIIKAESAKVTLYDRPLVDETKVRVTGPMTVEAVPSPSVKSPDYILDQTTISPYQNAETIRQEEWRSEMLSTGIRGKAGQKIIFSRLEALSGTRYIHAEGESANVAGRILLSFSSPYTPLDQRHVELAIEEARSLQPPPKMLIFAAFQFDPEAAKDIDETQWPGITLLKVQINTDLLTRDLKKKRATNESYWLVGQPDVIVKRLTKGPDKGKFSVELNGFDYYNTLTGSIESGDKSKIAAWMLDPDYDGRSVFPRQLFLPMSGKDEGFSKLAKNLKAEIDTELLEKFHGTESIPFEPGTYKRVAVKIVDDRGIESLKILTLE